MRQFLLPVLLLAAGCGPAQPASVTVDTLPGGIVRVWNTAPSQWTDSAQFDFVEAAVLAPGAAGQGELDQVTGIALDDSGAIYVAQQPARVDRFGADGKWVRMIGRSGGGPGEYQSALIAVAGDQLVIHDPNSARTSVFAPNGDFVRSWPSSCCAYRLISTDSAGRVYVPAIPSDPAQFGVTGTTRFTIQGVVIDTLWPRKSGREEKVWEFSPGPGSRTRFNVPFQPALIDLPWRGGGFLYGDQGTYTFYVSPAATDTARIFGRTYVPGIIPDSVREDWFNRMTERNPNLRAVAKLVDIPTVAPAFRGFHQDGVGRIWVNVTPRGTSGRTIYDLFDAASGVWLGTAVMPFTAVQVDFRGDRVAVATTDEDDLMTVKVYRIVERTSR